MTISSTTNRVNYTGNGVTTAFAFPYKFLANADLKVYQEGTLKTITTHYTVTGAGDDAGGTVTFLVAPANLDDVVIIRDPAILQGLDLVENDNLPAESLENSFDLITMVAQRLDDRISRAFVLNDADVSGPDLTIPSPVADEIIGWNSAGDALESKTVALLGAVSIPVSIAQGGTGSATAADARSALAVLSSAEHQTQIATRFTASGTADVITGTLSPAIASYAAGLRVTTTPSGANTVTGPTLNLNSLGTKTVKKRDSGGSKVALVAGDYNASGPFDFEYDGTDFVLLNPVAAASTSAQIQPISASVAANALTISAPSLSLDFRSTTLGSGTVATVSGDPADLVISSGSTLGTVSATQSRIAVLAINNAGAIELAAVNVSGGNDLSETGLISTTAEGGAGNADSANVIYSITARTNVAYRVIGYIESTQATAGTWATAPSTIQGAGGNAVTAMSSIGYGQTWQNVTGSRTAGTTYYNTTGRPIQVCLSPNSAGGGAAFSMTVGGVSVMTTSQPAGCWIPMIVTVPPGVSYIGVSSVSFVWTELR